MPTATQVQPNFTFVKGIITEASPLTFPENATIDEENFELDISGKRSRRLGIDFETSYQYIDTGFGVGNTLSNYKIQTFRWDNAGNDPTNSLLVVRVGTQLKFFDLFSVSQSPNEVTSPTSLPIADKDITFVSVNGMLVAAQGGNGVLWIFEYDGTTITFSTKNPMVRDVWGVDDSLETDERPSATSALSDTHKYNLFNQGWDTTKIDQFAESLYSRWKTRYYYVGSLVAPTTPNGFYYKAQNSGTTGSTEPTWPTTVGLTVVDNEVTWIAEGTVVSGSYPSNADLIALGEKTDGAWDKDLIKDYLLGTTPAPKGKFVLNIFSTGIGRNAIDGISGLDYQYVSGSGYGAAAGYAGRLFVAGLSGTNIQPDDRTPNLSGAVLFSQLTNNIDDLNKFYQEADPTAEDINELVATDGGIIQIPEASSIHKLVPLNTSLIVFAENGVWEILGGEGGFAADDYQVRKITDIGSANPEAVVKVEGSVLYWSKGGIYAIQPDQTQTIFTAVNLSENTVQTLYLAIPSNSKANAKGHYTTEDKLVRWLYQSDGDEVKQVHDKELVFDTQLQAFYKLGYTQPTALSPEICGLYSTPNAKVESQTEDVIDNLGATVVDALGADVTIDVSRRVTSTTSLKYITLEKPATGNWKYTFSQRTDTTFKDWVTFGDSADSPAYLETGYNISGDSMRYKQVPYINFHFLRTETGFETDMSPSNPSGCLVQPKWDWSEHINSGKFGTQFQAYRLNRNYIPSGSGDAFNEGHVVITTKNKLRGRGRALSLRMDTESGKDCQLLGWSLVMTGNTVV